MDSNRGTVKGSQPPAGLLAARGLAALGAYLVFLGAK
jgi:hypothetical protein